MVASDCCTLGSAPRCAHTRITGPHDANCCGFLRIRIWVGIPFDASRVYEIDIHVALTPRRALVRKPGARMDTEKLSTANLEALGTCRDAAAKTKKEQRCTVVVPAT
jgi:Family of unknown function (DUF6118)